MALLISAVGAVFEADGAYWFLVATTARGEVYAHFATFEDEARAVRFAAKVEAHGSINPDHWAFWRTVYGSAAFEDEEAEAVAAAGAIRAGLASLEDLPTNIRTLL